MVAASAVTSGWRSWNGPARLHGVDLARALAVLGMLAAHLLTIEDPFTLTRPETWIDLVNGRSSVLFALLAGVSLALVTGGLRPLGGPELSRARVRIAVRAAVLWVVGVLLIQTGVPVYVILPAYAILFLLALPALSAKPAALWGVAATVAVLVPWVLPVLDILPDGPGEIGETVSLLLGLAYPFPVWIAFLLAGIAIGRTDLRQPYTQIVLLSGGLAVAVGAALLSEVLDGSGFLDDPYLAAVWSAVPHSSGIIDVVGSAGVAASVLGGCLLICRTPLTWVLAPLRAVGSMPLTAYAGQILAWAVAALVLLGDTGDLFGFRELRPLGWFIAGTIVSCTVWAVLRGQGPLERALARLVAWLVPTDAAPPPPGAAPSRR
ncbi:heparan-alpha-glucosaminide N-acetyltransferase domain-containing protein [Microbacterium sp.]|uniref:heparan-alpha-glucosaminide N-acetyltransferase domain-containing protein n=1 Tax=Microbacterium sp. TaxID=51671 RepID=UPI003734C307